jgi:hypothetical protein
MKIEHIILAATTILSLLTQEQTFACIVIAMACVTLVRISEADQK